jgi:hypothetical protein
MKTKSIIFMLVFAMTFISCSNEEKSAENNMSSIDNEQSVPFRNKLVGLGNCKLAVDGHTYEFNDIEISCEIQSDFYCFFKGISKIQNTGLVINKSGKIYNTPEFGVSALKKLNEIALDKSAIISQETFHNLLTKKTKNFNSVLRNSFDKCIAFGEYGECQTTSVRAKWECTYIDSEW